MACASDQRCTTVGCCRDAKACVQNTQCCEEGETCVMDKECCPDGHAASWKCCTESEQKYQNLCCDIETTKGVTTNNLDIPVKYACGQAAGMYDSVTKKIYTNKGSGDFITP